MLLAIARMGLMDEEHIVAFLGLSCREEKRGGAENETERLIGLQYKLS